VGEASRRGEFGLSSGETSLNGAIPVSRGRPLPPHLMYMKEFLKNITEN